MIGMADQHTGGQNGVKIIQIAPMGRNHMMGQTEMTLAALIGSRICHDLISPIGAINNGLELLSLTAPSEGPELDLIADSVTNASARIRFFRVAFGAASDQEIGSSELQTILGDYAAGSKLAINYNIDAAHTRREIRLVLLAILCLENALAYGGAIDVSKDGDNWSIVGKAAKLNVDAALWSRLRATGGADEIAPAQVQFALLPLAAAEIGRAVGYDTDAETVTVTL